ncbi:hypothetical protein [Streptomyces sp. NPDC059850]|uniref:hypothetical protein n=1 Tax=Streptomyces sp. NPDC059850 TaxID=3346970 RepID=UPI00365B804B
MTACAFDATRTTAVSARPRERSTDFTITPDRSYGARLTLSGDTGCWFPERWTLDGPEPYAVPLPGTQPEEPDSDVLPLSDGQVLIHRRVAGHHAFSLLYPTGPGTGERVLGGIDRADVSLLPPAPGGSSAYALGRGPRSTSVWLIHGGPRGLQHLAEVPGRCTGGAWLDRMGRLLALDRELDGRTKTIVVDLGRGGETSPLLQITERSNDRLLLADPDSGLLLVRSDAPGDERLGWGVLGSALPVRFPDCLRPAAQATAVPFAIQPGQMLTPEACAVAFRIDAAAGGRPWVGVWRPSERRLRQFSAPEGWLAGAGLWSREAELWLPYATRQIPCGLARVWLPEATRTASGSPAPPRVIRRVSRPEAAGITPWRQVSGADEDPEASAATDPRATWSAGARGTTLRAGASLSVTPGADAGAGGGLSARAALGASMAPGAGSGAGLGVVSGAGAGAGAGAGLGLSPGTGLRAGGALGTGAGLRGGMSADPGADAALGARVSTDPGAGSGAGLGVVSSPDPGAELGAGPGAGLRGGADLGAGPGLDARGSTALGAGAGSGAGLGVVSGADPGAGAGTGLRGGMSADPGAGAALGAHGSTAPGPGLRAGAGSGADLGVVSGPDPGAGLGVAPSGGLRAGAGLGSGAHPGAAPRAGGSTGLGVGPGAGLRAGLGAGAGSGAGAGLGLGPGAGLGAGLSVRVDMGGDGTRGESGVEPWVGTGCWPGVEQETGQDSELTVVAPRPVPLQQAPLARSAEPRPPRWVRDHRPG